MIKKESLLRKIKRELVKQGFRINPHIRPAGYSKRTYRRIQQVARTEQISKHKEFLNAYFDKAKLYCRDGNEIVPEKIRLELREVKPDTQDEMIFRWWNFIWWSIPFQRSYGRQLRFLLWDVQHNAPFGLISLQSPILKMSVRDKALSIPKNELDYWVNRSLHAQRVGALPPYNALLGGKMVALAMISKEIRDAYREKYRNTVSLIKGRTLPSDLLFITTTSAFGKSSIYNRLKIHGEVVAECLGETKGSGSFHIPDPLYTDLLKFLKKKRIDVDRGYGKGFGHGPSRKLKLVSMALHYLGLRSFQYHGLKRDFYMFPLASNLREVIRDREDPVVIDRKFAELVSYWKERWALPRAKRLPNWLKFRKSNFFRKARQLLDV